MAPDTTVAVILNAPHRGMLVGADSSTVGVMGAAAVTAAQAVLAVGYVSPLAYREFGRTVSTVAGCTAALNARKMLSVVMDANVQTELARRAPVGALHIAAHDVRAVVLRAVLNTTVIFVKSELNAADVIRGDGLKYVNGCGARNDSDSTPFRENRGVNRYDDVAVGYVHTNVELLKRVPRNVCVGIDVDTRWHVGLLVYVRFPAVVNVIVGLCVVSPCVADTAVTDMRDKL